MKSLSLKAKKTHLVFLSILLFSILIRTLVIYTEYQNINSDNAILGLMAKHILKGEFPVFFYGQPYMGSAEAFVIAFFFLLFGISTKTISLAMTFITAFGIISIYLLGKELKDKTLGLYAMLFAALPPVYFFWHGLAAFGGYPEMFLYGNLLLFFALKIINADSQFIKFKYYILLGFFAGLAFWTHLLIIYYIVPIAIFLIIDENKKILFLKAPFFVLPGFVLGGLPFWIYNLKHNFESFGFSPSGNLSQGLIHLINTIPGLLSGDLSSPFFQIVLFMYIFSFLFLIIKPEKTKTPVSSKFIFFLLSASIAYFFSTSPMSHTQCPRYIIPLLTVIMISVSYLTWYLNKKIRYLGLIPLIFVVSFNGINFFKSYLIDKPEGYADHVQMTQLIDFLDRNKLHTNYSTFWISEKLNFLSNEKIINAIYDNEKYLPYEDILEESDNIAVVETDTRQEPMLGMLCESYSKSQVGQFYIFYNFKPKNYYGQMMPAENWEAKSNYNSKDLRHAFDRNSNTYWGTITTKTKGMYFELDLGRVYEIYKIAIFNSSHWRNFPQDVSVQISENGKDWNKLNLPNYPDPLFLSGPRLYWHLQDGRIEFIFPPINVRYIKISQDAMDALNPWEINEIFVWKYSGEREFDSAETQDIYNFLVKKGIKNLYADFYISAKIHKLSNGKIKTLIHINKQYPYRENTSRLIDICDKTAFIIDNENLDESCKILSELKINAQKQKFKNYTCLYFGKAPPMSRYLYWSGYGLLTTNLFKETPAVHRKEIVFKGNIKFLGYNLEIFNRTLKMDYFWQLKKLNKYIFGKDIFVFVYFMKDNKIVFQNDHPLLEQFPFDEKLTGREIFKETYIIENIPPDTYDIIIGLNRTDKNNKRITIIDPKGRKSKELIGSVTIK